MTKDGDATRAEFFAHAPDEGSDSGHAVGGAESFQDAAIRFAEDRLGDLEDGEVRVIVTDRESGERHCFCVDVGRGSAEPC